MRGCWRRHKSKPGHNTNHLLFIKRSWRKRQNVIGCEIYNMMSVKLLWKILILSASFNILVASSSVSSQDKKVCIPFHSFTYNNALYFLKHESYNVGCGLYNELERSLGLLSLTGCRDSRPFQFVKSLHSWVSFRCIVTNRHKCEKFW